MWSAIWHFIQLSGYGTVAIVVGIQIAQTYALYYTQSLRISLMTDSDPATMVQSLKYYLLVNVFVSVTRRQIRKLEEWIRRTVLTTRLEYKMRREILQLVLSMPLPLLESLPYSTMSDLYIQCVNSISQAFPMTLCVIMVSNKLSAVATFIRVIKTSPGLLVMCGPLAALNYAIERLHRGTEPNLYDVRREAISRPRERLDNVLECNRPLLRIHDMTDTYLDKLCQLKAIEISYESSSDAVRRSHYLISTLFTEIIETTILMLRYRPDLDPALNDLSFVVHNKEKIGIVGRTGAGKSSLTYALMRLVEADSGSIIIDGVDISTIGLHDLRSRISIIPQDPSLFEGTIRDNLDPTHQYTDDEVWAAIDACQIADLLDEPTIVYKSKTKNSEKSDPTSKEESKQLSKVRKRHWLLGTGLDKWVKYKGSNFSVGQQQLVSLCRALLWRRKILVLDEATANVDTKTDQIMQSVIRQEFKDCTVLTIAHRINTIMDSDRVLVMDQGKVAEFDTPSNLLARDSHFKRLVECMNLSKKQGQTAE
ncbi:hypothetical protein GGI03_003229 [Coemansia sp. RSA 2337]|nr:hypothetical protein GGI03_003229 [Coemansia sp. RSA 2337]